LAELKITDLHAKAENKEIIKGLTLACKQGEIHAIMGPNGSGKSTLSSIIMGNPKYEVTKGKITFENKNILALKPDERSKLGLFLSFQYPFEIQGLSFSKFMHAAYKTHNPLNTESLVTFRKRLKKEAAKLNIPEDFIDRELNVDFSGGEKKRAEILQMAILKPKIAILDETDSGLDIDSLKIVAEAINKMKSEKFGAIVITHYQRILNYIKPDKVHIMHNGKIILSGGIELAEKLEKKGYNEILAEKGIRVLEAQD